jgi:signal transduction histidine kinase
LADQCRHRAADPATTCRNQRFRHRKGIVEYEYVKPGQTKPQPKMSYVTGYAPWGWVIGTGVYIDDLTAQAGAPPATP